MKILDKGHIRLVRHAASDDYIVQAARVSYGNGTKTKREDDKLIDYLLRNEHGTPFEMCSFVFHVKCPIFVARQWFRHRSGCLSGNNRVTFVDKFGVPSKDLEMTVKDIYDKWHFGQKCLNSITEDQIIAVDDLIAAGVSRRQALKQIGITRNAYVARKTSALPFGKRCSKSRLRKMNLRVLNEQTGQFQIGHLNDVFYKGKQEVFLVTLRSGNSIEMTKSHLCYTNKGWKTLAQCLVEDVALACTPVIPKTPMTKAATVEEWRSIKGYEGKYEVSNQGMVRTWVNTRNVKLAVPKIRKITQTKLGRAFVGLSSNGITLPFQVSKLVATAFLPNPDALPYVCHVDDNALNNSVDNLYWGNEETNKKDACRNSGKQTSFLEYSPIASCVSLGNLPTYDLSVEGEWHNFLGNGIVVHNSFNEVSARYSEMKDEFYVPELKRIQGQSPKNKQCSGEALKETNQLIVQKLISSANKKAYRDYKMLLDLGVARELARTILPVSLYTEFYWGIDLRNLLKFIELRSHSHAQPEIQEYAKAIKEIIKDIVPATIKSYDTRSSN